MTLRFVTETGTEFILHNPHAIDTMISGPCLRAPHYWIVHRDGRREQIPFTGDFRLSDAVVIERADDQLELTAAA